MEVIYHRKFLRMYGKVPSKVQMKFENRVSIFHKTPFDKRLRNHPLTGGWSGFRSIDITGDWRVIYVERSSSIAEFYAIGTHSQLYR